jgi:hypothetical protein
VTENSSLPVLSTRRRSERPWAWYTAVGSVGVATGVTLTGGVRRMATKTIPAKMITNAAIAKRAVRCHRTMFLFYRLDISDVELEVGLALVLVAIE